MPSPGKYDICDSISISFLHLNLAVFCLVVGESEDVIPGLGQYDDFQTIDWQRDLARDRMRHRYIVKHKKDSVWDFIKAAHDAWSGWMCLFLVGLAAGKYFILFFLFFIISNIFFCFKYRNGC